MAQTTPPPLREAAIAAFAATLILIGGIWVFGESPSGSKKIAAPSTAPSIASLPATASKKITAAELYNENALVRARENVRTGENGITITKTTNFAQLLSSAAEKVAALETAAGGKDAVAQVQNALKNPGYQLWLARYKLLSAVAPADWDKIREVKNSLAFLNAIFNDREWLVELSASGPVENFGNSLRLLARLWLNDKTKLLATHKSIRNLATATALNAVGSDQTNLDMYLQYLQAWRDELLHPTFADLSSREMRYVVGYKQRPVTEEIYSMAKFHSQPRQKYPGLCWIPGYKLKNFFGDSIHGPKYYAPWGHAYPLYEGTRKIGGVCGSLSHYGSAVLRVHGLPSTPAGQPAHCAFLFRDINSKRWLIGYSVNYGTGSHFTLWKRGTFPYMDMIEAVFQNREAQLTAEQITWALARQLRDKPTEFNPEVENLFVAAERAQPTHFGVYLAHAEWLHKLKPAAKNELWESWAQRVIAGLKDYPIGVWDLLNGQWLEPLAKRDVNQAFAYVKKYHAQLPQPQVPIAEQYNFNNLLETQAKWWKNDPTKNLEFARTVLEAQFGTSNFFSGAMKFGSDKLLNDPKNSAAFIKILGDIAEKSAAGKSGGLEQFLGSAVRTAATAVNFTSFHQLCDLYDRLSPIKGAPPAPKMKGLLVSKDGILRTSSAYKGENPQTWRRIIDGGAGVGAFHTGKEKAPWAEVVLPGPVNITGVYIDNSQYGKNAHRQAPMVVWISEDGKKWTEIHRETKVQGEYQIDLSKKPVRGKHIKVGRLPDAKNDVFHLRKIQVFADKKFY